MRCSACRAQPMNPRRRRFRRQRTDSLFDERVCCTDRCNHDPKRRNGCHALRHFYASTLLDSDESIFTRSGYRCRADPGFTLRTYAHLMPSSTERTKTANDAMLAGDAVEPDPEDNADGSEP